MLLRFQLPPLIFSCPCFIVPFIVSRNFLIFIIIADLCNIQVSRLILNLLEANCLLDESVYSKSMESLRFYHPQSNRDTEADTSRGDREDAFMGEGIYEEER